MICAASFRVCPSTSAPTSRKSTGRDEPDAPGGRSLVRAGGPAGGASRSMAETAGGGRARPPVIHGPRPRVHGVLLSPDVDLASATPGPTGLLYLQQVIGNRTVQRLLVARQQGA